VKLLALDTTNVILHGTIALTKLENRVQNIKEKRDSSAENVWYYWE